MERPGPGRAIRRVNTPSGHGERELESSGERTVEQVLELRRPGARTRRTEAGEWRFFANQRWRDYRSYEDEDAFSPGPTRLFFGLGSTRRAERLRAAGQGHRLYEPDPHRLHHFLAEYPELRGRHNWALGTGLWFEKGFFDPPDVRLVTHSYLKRLYDPLPQRLTGLFGGSRGGMDWLICQLGTLFYRDVVDTLDRRDRALFPFDVHLWEPRGLRRLLSRFPARTLFSINLIDGLASLLGNLGMEYVCWEVDPATSPYESTDEDGSAATRVYTYRENNLSRLREAGYRHRSYLPLATNPRRRRSIEPGRVEEQYRCRISFGGSSLAANANRLRERVAAWIRHHRLRSTPGEWSRFQRQFQRWVSRAPSWDENPIQPIERRLDEWSIPRVMEVDDEPLMAAMAVAETRAHRKRVQVVEAVGDHFPIHVWGDEGWENRVGRLGTYRGEAGHGDELTQIYNGSRVNLDINRLYQPDILTMRIFDAMATGGVVLTEPSRAVEELFEPGVHLGVYEGPDGLLREIRRLLNNPREAREMGRRGRESVIHDHTITQRLGRMGLL